MDVFEELVRLRRLGQKSALATIVEVRGSIPSFESAKLLVREDGSLVGTIGGGCVEAEVWNAAREVLETKPPPRHTGPDAAYDNGSSAASSMSSMSPSSHPTAYIFGAGPHLQEPLQVAALAASHRHHRQPRAVRQPRPLPQADELRQNEDPSPARINESATWSSSPAFTATTCHPALGYDTAATSA
jgi:xanthine/CO dehydrogenase XdhC/CoxF family maturation factor